MDKKKFKMPAIVRIIIFAIAVIILAVLLAKYLTDNDFRDNINVKLFRKEVQQDSLKSIEIDSENDDNIYAFGENIAILTKSKISIYNSDAEEIYTASVSLNNPIETANGDYMLLAENQGNRLITVDEKGIKYEDTVQGEIYKICINSNGYASIVSQDSTYESIITVFDNNGKELFKKFLAKGYAISAELADNNKFLAIGKIDYSGAIIKSTVEFISIDSTENNSILNSYEAESGDILVNAKFNTKNDLICVFDSYVEKMTESASEKIYEIEENDIFIDINLKNHIVIAQRESSGLFSYEYQIKLKNIVGKSDSLYILEKDVPKKIIATEKICCIRFANEIRLINSNGWLVKKYKITKDIRNIIMSDKIVGILYNNKIEIILL